MTILKLYQNNIQLDKFFYIHSSLRKEEKLI